MDFGTFYRMRQEKSGPKPNDEWAPMPGPSINSGDEVYDTNFPPRSRYDAPRGFQRGGADFPPDAHPRDFGGTGQGFIHEEGPDLYRGKSFGMDSGDSFHRGEREDQGNMRGGSSGNPRGRGRGNARGRGCKPKGDATRGRGRVDVTDNWDCEPKLSWDSTSITALFMCQEDADNDLDLSSKPELLEFVEDSDKVKKAGGKPPTLQKGSDEKKCEQDPDGIKPSDKSNDAQSECDKIKDVVKLRYNVPPQDHEKAHNSNDPPCKDETPKASDTPSEELYEGDGVLIDCDESFYCKLCDIWTTCQENLDEHNEGKTHLKNVKKTQLKKTANDELLSEETAKEDSQNKKEEDLKNKTILASSARKAAAKINNTETRAREDLGKKSFYAESLLKHKTLTKKTLLGLSYVTEYQSTQAVRCVCHLCGVKLLNATSESHMVGFKHHLMYMKRRMPWKYICFTTRAERENWSRHIQNNYLTPTFKYLERTDTSGEPKIFVFEDTPKKESDVGEEKEDELSRAHRVRCEFLAFIEDEYQKSKVKLTKEKEIFDYWKSHGIIKEDTIIPYDGTHKEVFPPLPPDHKPITPHERLLPDRPLSNHPLDEQPLIDHPLDRQPPPDLPFRRQPPPDHPLGRRPPPDHLFRGQSPPDHPLGRRPPPDHLFRGQSPPDHPLGRRPPPDHLFRGQSPPDHPLGRRPPPDHPFDRQPYQPPPDPFYSRGRDPYLKPEPRMSREDAYYARMRSDPPKETNRRGMPVPATDTYLHPDPLKRMKFNEPYIDPDPLKRILPSQKVTSKKPVVIDYGHGSEKKKAKTTADEWEEDFKDILNESKAPDSLAQLSCSYSSPKRENSPPDRKKALPFSKSYIDKYKVSSSSKRDKSPKRRDSNQRRDGSRSPVRKFRRSRSPDRLRISRSPSGSRRPRSPDIYRRPQGPDQLRRLKSHDRSRRSRSPDRPRRSRSPDQSRRSRSPDKFRRSRSPDQSRRSWSPDRPRRSRSPDQSRRSRSPDPNKFIKNTNKLKLKSKHIFKDLDREMKSLNSTSSTNKYTSSRNPERKRSPLRKYHRYSKSPEGNRFELHLKFKDKDTDPQRGEPALVKGPRSLGPVIDLTDDNSWSNQRANEEELSPQYRSMGRFKDKEMTPKPRSVEMTTEKEASRRQRSMERADLEKTSGPSPSDDVDDAQAEMIANMLLNMKSSIIGHDADPQTALKALLSQDITNVLLETQRQMTREASPSGINNSKYYEHIESSPGRPGEGIIRDKQREMDYSGNQEKAGPSKTINSRSTTKPREKIAFGFSGIRSNLAERSALPFEDDDEEDD